MVEPQFTPGPWQVVSRGILYITTEDRTVITSIEPAPDRELLPHEANARLIAAAPAMLKALDRLLNQPCPNRQYVRGHPAADEALAALSLALGEKQA